MSDEKKEHPKLHRRWILAVALPVLYVLSYGPATWMIVRLIWTHDLSVSRWPRLACEVYEVVYAPILWISEHQTWIADVLNWYGGLYGGI